MRHRINQEEFLLFGRHPGEYSKREPLLSNQQKKKGALARALYSTVMQTNYDFGAVACPRPCVSSRSCVSLSKCTFLPFDVITEPSAAFVVGRRLASFVP